MAILFFKMEYLVLFKEKKIYFSEEVIGLPKPELLPALENNQKIVVSVV